MHHDSAGQQFRQNLFSRHGGVQFILAGMDFAVGRLQLAEKDERKPASDEMLPLEQGRGLLIGASFGNDDDLCRGLLIRTDNRPLAPSKDLVSRHAGEAEERQKP